MASTSYGLGDIVVHFNRGTGYLFTVPYGFGRCYTDMERMASDVNFLVYGGGDFNLFRNSNSELVRRVKAAPERFSTSEPFTYSLQGIQNAISDDLFVTYGDGSVQDMRDIELGDKYRMRGNAAKFFHLVEPLNDGSAYVKALIRRLKEAAASTELAKTDGYNAYYRAACKWLADFHPETPRHKKLAELAVKFEQNN